MSRLKPCPFCGEELEIIANGQYYSHKREENSEKQCFGAVWVFPIDDEEMIRRWNTRKPMDKVVEQLEEKSVTFETDFTVKENKWILTNDAIEIVKRGGIDDN